MVGQRNKDRNLKATWKSYDIELIMKVAGVYQKLLRDVPVQWHVG